MSLSIIYLVLLIICLGSNAFAAGGGDGVPGIVLNQVINFTLFALILFFLLRNPIKEALNGKKQAFKEKFESAKIAREKAEQEVSGLKAKIKELSETESQTIAKAESDANSLKAKILSDAESQAANIKTEAEKTVKNEYARAESELTKSFFDQVIGDAEDRLSKDVSGDDEKRFQRDFVDNVQAVN